MAATHSANEDLNRIEAAIQALEALRGRGTLSDEQLETQLASWYDQRAVILARLEGDGTLVQGDGNTVLGKGAVAARSVAGSVITGGEVNQAGEDIIKGETVIVVKEGGRVVVREAGAVEMSAVDRETALGRYLEHIIAHNRYLQLQGIRSGGRLVSIELDEIYITLRASRQRSPFEEEVWLAHEAALAPGELRRGGQARPESEPAIVNIETALAERRHLVILGDPGSGKTTLLRYLALLYGRDLAGGSREVEQALGLPESGFLPALLPLRGIGAFLRQRRPQDDGAEGYGLLIEFLLEYFKNERLPLPPDFFDVYLKDCRAVLLLDGLDEVADPALRARVARLVESFTLANPGCRFVVTSRVVGYSGAARLGGDYAAATVQDFSLADIERFLANWHRLAAAGQLGPGPSAERHAVRQTEQLMQAIRDNERILDLAINPLMLTVIALVHRDRVKLPDRRAELYAEAVDVLLGKWDEARGVQEMAVLDDGPFDAGDKRLLLQEIALTMHAAQKKEISAEDLHRLLAERFAAMSGSKRSVRRAVERFLTVIQERTGLLAARGEGVYAFSHLTFQEYLAALAIAGRDDYVEYTLERSGDPWWREVILLEAGHLSGVNRERATRLVRAIAEKSDEPEPYHNLVLAAECVRDVGENRIAGNLESEIRGRLQRELESPAPERAAPQGWLNRLLRPAEPGVNAQELVKRRSAAAAALGRLGDGRFWSQPYGEPDWVRIPAGEFWMGSDEFDDEKPVYRVALPEYWISRVPITNAQYALFIKDSGHTASEGWTDGRLPRGRESHPVVLVSWYDAVEYCRWLGQAIGKTVRLPSEAEWEKAARGPDDRRKYPWGDEFDRAKCNTFELDLGDTTPAGIFSAGASPYGVLELSGNVWEWTRSLWGPDVEKPKYGYPYRIDDGRENSDASNNVLRVVRGGSFDYDHSLARCAYRSRYDPDFRDDDIGFRAGVSP